MNKKDYMRSICLCICIVICIFKVNSQVGINTDDPHEAADLTLGSSDRGFLPNKVALKTSNSASPLSSNLSIGTIIYNTTNDADLVEGLHIWNGTQWDRMVTALGKRMDNKLLAYTQTKNTAADMQVLPYISSSTTLGDELKSLSTTFSIERDGTVFINAILYAKLTVSSTQKFAFVGNTFFRIRVTDTTDGTYTDFIAACTPISTANATAFTDSQSGINTNNNPVGALCQGALSVKKDHQYTIKTYGQEGWVKKAQGTVTAGTYNWGDYRSYSSLKVDYVSDPY